MGNLLLLFGVAKITSSAFKVDCCLSLVLMLAVETILVGSFLAEISIDDLEFVDDDDDDEFNFNCGSSS